MRSTDHRRIKAPGQDRRPHRESPLLLGLLVLGGSLAAAGPASAGHVIDPSRCVPTSMDILFLFDTTGSMGGVLQKARSGATQVMDAVIAKSPGTRFAVAEYKDYPGLYSYQGYTAIYGSPGDYPWKLRQDFTVDNTKVGTAIESLSATGGADFPESMTRALNETLSLKWTTDAVRLVILFADAPPHDLDFGGLNYGGDPGDDGLAYTADDLDFQTVVSEVRKAGVHVVSVSVPATGPAANAMRYVATETGGLFAVMGNDFAGQITNLILQMAPANINEAEGYLLKAEVTAGTSAVEVPARAGPWLKRVYPEGGEGTLLDTSYNILGFEVSFNVAHTQTSGTERGYSKGLPYPITSQGRHVVTDLRIVHPSLGTVVGADLVEAFALSAARPGTATSQDAAWAGPGRSQFVGLTVLDAPVSRGVPPNTVVPIGPLVLPGFGALGASVVRGELVLNEQVHETGPGPASSMLRVNMVHLRLGFEGMAGGIALRHTLDLVVASAFSASACQGTLLGSGGLTRDDGILEAEPGCPPGANAPLPGGPTNVCRRLSGYPSGMNPEVVCFRALDGNPACIFLPHQATNLFRACMEVMGSVGSINALGNPATCATFPDADAWAPVAATMRELE